MSYIDFHADTITELEEGETLRQNNKMVTLQRLMDADCKLQFFSAFVPTGFLEEGQRDVLAWEKYQKIQRRYTKTLEENADRLQTVTSGEDLQDCLNSDRIGTVFTIEDGGVIGGDMEKLYRVYEDGVRLISLTWNHENAIGFPNSKDLKVMEKGLKPFGLEMIEEMEHLGMIIDVSHLSDGGFWDIYNHTKEPFVASHSNARSLCDHPRNLTDDMIRAIAERGGIIGLNLFGPFLGGSKESRIEDMVRHVQHIYRIGGAEALALGSDFDGITGDLEVGDPTRLVLLFDALKSAGIPESVIEKMKMKNGLRLLEEIL